MSRGGWALLWLLTLMNSAAVVYTTQMAARLHSEVQAAVDPVGKMASAILAAIRDARGEMGKDVAQ